MNLAGAHVVVTGGSSGIGLEAARESLQRGARVSILARDRDRLAAAAEELGEVTALSVDVTDRAAVHDAFETLDPCDGLITCAGMVEPGLFLEQSHDVRVAHLTQNYLGTLHAVEAAVPGMAARRRGAIVGVASAAVLVGGPGYSGYGASKHAMRGLLEALRAELAPLGITVGCAFPPDTATPMLDYEQPRKPVETKAVTGAIKPLSAARVGRSIVDGLESGHAQVFVDARTWVLARIGACVPRALNWFIDRRVGRVACSG